MSSTQSDPKERSLTWLETYFTTANVTDDATNSTRGLFMYEDAEFPLEAVFIDLARDYTVTVGEPDLTPIYNADKTTDSYRETVPLTVIIFNRAGVTAEKVKWKIERELRRIAETYMFGSVRAIKSRKDNSKILGGERMFSFIYELTYTRSAQ